MAISEEVLVEDWLGLESEIERLLMVYGYPVEEPSEFVIWVDAEADTPANSEEPRPEGQAVSPLVRGGGRDGA